MLSVQLVSERMETLFWKRYCRESQISHDQAIKGRLCAVRKRSSGRLSLPTLAPVKWGKLKFFDWIQWVPNRCGRLWEHVESPGCNESWWWRFLFATEHPGAVALSGTLAAGWENVCGTLNKIIHSRPFWLEHVNTTLEFYETRAKLMKKMFFPPAFLL